MAFFNDRDFFYQMCGDALQYSTSDEREEFSDWYAEMQTEAMADDLSGSPLCTVAIAPEVDITVNEDCYVIHHQVQPYMHKDWWTKDESLVWEFHTEYFDPQTMCGDYSDADGWVRNLVSTHASRAEALDAATLAAATLAGRI